MLDQEERKDGDLLLQDRPSDSPAPTSDERGERGRRAPAGAEPPEAPARLAIDQPGWSAQVKPWTGETATMTMPADATRRHGLIAARVRTTAAPRQPFPPLPQAEAAEVSGASLEPAAAADPSPPVAEAVAPAPPPAAARAVAQAEPAAEEVSPYLAAARRAAEAARERAAKIRTGSPAPLPPQPLQAAPRPPAPRQAGWLERGVSVQRAAEVSRIGFRPLTGSDREKPYRTEYKALDPQPPAVAAARIVSATRPGNAIAREERFRRLAREIEAQQRHATIGREEPSSHASPDEGADAGLWRRWSRRLAGGA